MAVDVVRMSVPAKPEYARMVRMTAASLVGRTALGYDEVDDVRIAAEEAFVYACDHAPDNGDIDIDFVLDGESIEIRVALADSSRIADEEAERRAAYATFILQSVCDRFEMSTDENGTYLKVVKNLPPETDNADG